MWPSPTGQYPGTPCREVKLPRDDRDERRFLTPTEADDLADAIDGRYQAFVLTGTYTGSRFGELAALRTNDLDTLRRTLRVDEQFGRQGSWRMLPGPLKSKKAYRTVGIPAFLVAELAAHVTAYRSGSDLIFSHAEGGPLDYNRFRRRHGGPRTTPIRSSDGHLTDTEWLTSSQNPRKPKPHQGLWWWALVDLNH